MNNLNNNITTALERIAAEATWTPSQKTDPLGPAQAQEQGFCNGHAYQVREILKKVQPVLAPRSTYDILNEPRHVISNNVAFYMCRLR